MTDIRPATHNTNVAVVVPTLNAGRQAIRLARALDAQTVRPDEIIFVDSASNDGSLDLVSKYGVQVVPIERAAFHHAEARNWAVSHTRSKYIVFFSQDALPVDDRVIERLLEALNSGAAAAYARQVARPNATPLEKFARGFNYPPTPPNGSPSISAGQGIRSVFFSNSCSAIRREVFDAMGGFPTHTIMNEDMVFAANLRRVGHTISYVPEAKVEHSHDYTLWQTLNRYFDIGVVFDQAKGDLLGREATSEGIRYVRELFTALVDDRQYAWIPAALAESAAKWVGTFLGKHHKLLPLALVRRLSMHKSYWDRND